MLRKHLLMNEVAAEFLKVYQVPGQDRFKVKIRWWNIGKCHAPYCMHLIQKLELTSEQLKEFIPYEWKGKENVIRPESI